MVIIKKVTGVIYYTNRQISIHFNLNNLHIHLKYLLKRL